MTRGLVRGVVLIVVAAGFGVLGVVSEVAAPPGRGAGAAAAARWRAVVSGPTVPHFEAVAALSSRDVWAVGAIGKDPRLTPVAAHWDRRSLNVMQPFPPSIRGVLNGVAALAPDDVWAVGTLKTGPEFDDARGVILHWDGGRWSEVATPLPSASDLEDVSATSATDVWVAGDEFADVQVAGAAGPLTVHRPLLVHWDGSRWRRDDVSPLIPQCPEREDVAGYAGLVWWCGYGIEAIDAAGRDDVWAVGTEDGFDCYSFYAIALHSDGTSWTAHDLPASEGCVDEARDVDAMAPGEAWMLDRFRLIHWRHGRARSFDYRARGADVAALAAVSSSSVWIVGKRWSDDRNTARPIVIHSNGKTALRQRSALDSQHHATLASLSVLSPVEIWAVGDHLLARYSP